MAKQQTPQTPREITLTGHDAISYAREHGLTLSKYTDPTEEAREGLSVDEAQEIAGEDPSLIYVTPSAARSRTRDRYRIMERGGHSRTWFARSWPEAARVLGVTPTPRPQAMDTRGDRLTIVIMSPVACTRSPYMGSGTREQIDTLPICGTYYVEREEVR